MTMEESLYDTAVEALMSPLHQARTKAEIAVTAARRTKQVNDMRYYWNIITKQQQQQQQPCESSSSTGRTEVKDGGGAELSSAAGPPLLNPPPLLWSSSSNPSSQVRLIHITGTKGKGSTACLCEAMLRANGYSTGLFTSPHLIDIRERLRWNGQLVHKNIFGRVYWKIRTALETAAAAATRDDVDTTTTANNNNNNGVTNSDDASMLVVDIPPTLPGYFRMLTLMGYYMFLIEIPSIDVLIVEVGMGGRYDVTNFLNEDMFKQRACGVTLLDYDHVQILGNTLEKIAWEKGGIFAVDKLSPDGMSPKDIPPDEQLNEEEEDDDDDDDDDENLEPGTRRRQYYVLDSNTRGVVQMMRSCARIEGCGGDIVLVDASGKAMKAALGQRSLGLAGEHQYGNAMLALALCQEVTQGCHDNDGAEKVQSRIKLTSTATLDALANASWPARCQTLECDKFTLRLDGAHTPQSVKATVDWFKSKLDKEEKPILVFNCSHERDPVEFLMTLSSRLVFCKVFFAKCNSSKPSAVDESSAETLLMEHGIPIRPELLPKKEEQGTITWLETLASIWKHLTYDVMRTDESSLLLFDQNIYCNMNAVEVLNELNSIAGHQTTNHTSHEVSEAPLQVLVTGSLYLIGSFLSALEWAEESSPPE